MTEMQFTTADASVSYKKPGTDFYDTIRGQVWVSEIGVRVSKYVDKCNTNEFFFPWCRVVSIEWSKSK